MQQSLAASSPVLQRLVRSAIITLPAHPASLLLQVAQAALDALNSNVTPQQFSSIFLRVLAEPQGPNVLAQVANAMIGLSNCATVSPVLSTVAANLQARNSQVAAYNKMVVAQYPQLAQCFAQATGATSLPAASG